MTYADVCKRKIMVFDVVRTAWEMAQVATRDNTVIRALNRALIKPYRALIEPYRALKEPQ
jgi:hypothetical protein